MRLYDVEKREYDELPQGISNFRSTKPYRCTICHAISNEYVLIKGYPGGGLPPIVVPLTMLVPRVSELPERVAGNPWHCADVSDYNTAAIPQSIP
jgi:hypothetical protein